jgi:CheY-like chemotaxis protein
VFTRMVISQYLRECDYRVIETASADEAVIILQHAEIHVDVVFSDVALSGAMDGFAFSAWVRANSPGVAVTLTGSAPRAAMPRQSCARAARFPTLRVADCRGSHQAADCPSSRATAGRVIAAGRPS